MTVISTSISCRTGSVVREQQQDLLYKRIDNYDTDFDKGLIERVGIPPDFVLTYIRRADNMPGYAPYTPTEAEMTIIEKELELLPDIHRQILEKRLVGIYFIENFLGSGLADYIIGDDDTVYTILIFNPRVLQSSLSEYVSYKENSCFVRDDSSTRVEIQLCISCSTSRHTVSIISRGSRPG